MPARSRHTALREQIRSVSILSTILAGLCGTVADLSLASAVDTVFIVERTGNFNGQPGQIGSFPSNDPSDVSVLGATSPAPVFYGIDVHPNTGQLFGIARTPTVTIGSLYAIDSRTGLGTIVGDVDAIDLNPSNVGGLSFNLSGSTLFGTDSDSLFAIDTATGELTEGWTLEIDGGSPDFQLAALAVVTTSGLAVPQGTLIGLAVYPTFPPPAQPAEIVQFSLSPMIAHMTIVTTLNTPGSPDFSQIEFVDQGLDFSPDGVLYACLMGVADTATFFTVSLTDPTLGDATYLGRVGTVDPPMPTTWWELGGIAVGPMVPVVCETCAGDVDGNNQVDARDVAPWVSAAITYGNTQQIPAGFECADMDDDGDIDVVGAPSDLQLFVQRLVAGPPACAAP